MSKGAPAKDSLKISTNRTIFADQTKESNYGEQRLVALDRPGGVKFDLSNPVEKHRESSDDRLRSKNDRIQTLPRSSKVKVPFSRITSNEGPEHFKPRSTWDILDDHPPAYIRNNLSQHAPQPTRRADHYIAACIRENFSKYGRQPIPEDDYFPPAGIGSGFDKADHYTASIRKSFSKYDRQSIPEADNCPPAGTRSDFDEYTPQPIPEADYYLQEHIENIDSLLVIRPDWVREVAMDDSGKDSSTPTGYRGSPIGTVVGEDEPAEPQDNLAVQGTELTLQALLRRVEKLSAQNSTLRERLGEKKRTGDHTLPSEDYRWQTFHKVDGTICVEEPIWTDIIDQDSRKPKAQSPIRDLEMHIKRHTDLAFVTFRYYPAVEDPKKHGEDCDNGSAPPPRYTYEEFRLCAPVMIEAMDAFLEKVPTFNKHIPKFKTDSTVKEPYLFWYCIRSQVESSINSLSDQYRPLIRLFMEWIEGTYGSEWDLVDEEFSKGLVSPVSMKYLIRPGDVLVCTKGEATQAYMADSWTSVIVPGATSQVRTRLQGRIKPLFDAENNEGEIRDAQKASRNTQPYKWGMEVWKWRFDDVFHKAKSTRYIEFTTPSPLTKVAITSLEMFPLRFADDSCESLLRKRGQVYWSVRKGKRLVSYTDTSGYQLNGNDRYMVDMATYQQYKAKKEKETSRTSLISSSKPKQDEMEKSIMELDEFPDTGELLLFPETIVAYGLRQKAWIDIKVEGIEDVSWNTDAFESLAVDYEIRELVQAVITHQIQSPRGNDVIADKGNGLILLLHGPPGTGKTFTAESVAEYVKKPLYRVTCGDIGTDPEQVETYLESVLHLGRIWDCVVLLDEADLYLEQRSKADMGRNALVSAFLRVLEYYGGILILTSNRVGTFDEAFKSRIQLSLHYTKLDLTRRRQIWENFIDRLESLGETDVNFKNLKSNYNNLANTEMNGRQIRNAITTARQLARFRGHKLQYHHLKHVIDIGARFDEYIKAVNEGLDDDDAAREVGAR